MKTYKNRDGGIETSEELKQKYNPEGSPLRSFQIRMLEMLIYIDKICSENNIDYVLSCGNVLGAVRHGGFIPWDDDVDIYIRAKDKRKLETLLLSEKYRHTDYVLQTHKTDPGHFLTWPVLRDKKSEYVKNNREHNAKKYRGAQIDIFPLTHLAPRFLVLLTLKFESINRKLFMGKNQTLANFLYGMEKYFVIPICRFLSFFVLPFKWNKWKNLWRIDFATPFINEVVPDTVMFPVSKVLFEGYEFNAPHDVDEYLRSVYGPDYMTLPSVKNRDCHDIIEYKVYK